MTKEEKGIVYCKVDLESTEVPINIMKKKSTFPPIGELPQKILPKGLSDVRKKYLFEKIRKFCSYESRDMVAPNPAIHDQTPKF